MPEPADDDAPELAAPGPAEEPDREGLDLEALADRIELPDDEAVEAAGAAFATRGPGEGGLGRLAELTGWLAGGQGRCPPRPLERVRAIVIAGDHGVAASDVSASPPEHTADAIRAIVAGTAPVAVLADVVGAQVRVVAVSVADELADLPAHVSRHRVAGRSGRIDREDATTREVAEAAFAVGAAVVDEEVDAGADILVLGHLGVAATTPAAVLTTLLTRAEVAEVVGRGSGIDDRGWMRKTATVRDAARRGRPVVSDRLGLLATVGGADLAALTGLLVQAAVRRTPVVLDGEVVTAAALVAQRIAYRSPRWWLAGQLSPAPAQQLALRRLDLVPLVDHGVQDGSGAGALLAVPALRAASRLLDPPEDAGGVDGAADGVSAADGSPARA